MSIVKRATTSLARRDSVSKIASERPTQTPVIGNLMNMIGTSFGIVPQLQTYTQSAVLFSIVNRISEAVSSTEWQLFRKGRTPEDRTQIEQHPFLDLWDRPNPFTTRMEFLQASQQHMDLVGEFWWVIAIIKGKMELWPIRPDRIRPIPHPTDFISSYLYRIGNRGITLELDDVIFQKMPNPLDAYRGIGPVGALLTDLQGEKAATDWSMQFFRNSAEPGGVIELEEEMSDPEFEKFVNHWEMQHKGQSNAHRVAIIERGKWIERKFTQRDMQFEQLRRFNIDLFLLAFGVHKHILGMTADVNRANAEAAEDSFARWVLKPRLDRIKGAVNEQLMHLFGEDLELDYVDPTPADRDRDLAEATRGWRVGLLRKNEARTLLNLPELTPAEGGEDFNSESNPFSGFGLSPSGGDVNEPSDDGGDEEEELAASIYGPMFTKATDDDLIENPVQRAETAMQRGWAGRLRQELSSLLALIEEHSVRGIGPVVVKVEVSDVAAYDWDWFSKYGDDIIRELSGSFESVILGQIPNLVLPRAQELALQFAQFRAAELIAPMAEMTREHVRTLVANHIDSGEGIQALRSRLQEDLMFSRRRAETVARTETRIAMGQGQKGAAVEQNQDEKRWVTQGRTDPRVDPVCLANERQGWIGIWQPFESGHDTIPAHPS